MNHEVGGYRTEIGVNRQNQLNTQTQKYIHALAKLLESDLRDSSFIHHNLRSFSPEDLLFACRNNQKVDQYMHANPYHLLLIVSKKEYDNKDQLIAHLLTSYIPQNLAQKIYHDKVDYYWGYMRLFIKSIIGQIGSGFQQEHIISPQNLQNLKRTHQYENLNFTTWN